MIRVERRPQFLLDLAEELTWLDDHAGPEVAERWYQALKRSVQFLEQTPHAGRLRSDLTPVGIRSWRVKGFPRWLIFYRASQDGEIVLLRIRTGDMDLPALPMTG